MLKHLPNSQLSGSKKTEIKNISNKELFIAHTHGKIGKSCSSKTYFVPLTSNFGIAGSSNSFQSLLGITFTGTSCVTWRDWFVRDGWKVQRNNNEATLMWAHLPISWPLGWVYPRDLWRWPIWHWPFWILVQGQQTTDGKVMHKSPPGISTGGLNKINIQLAWWVQLNHNIPYKCPWETNLLGKPSKRTSLYGYSMEWRDPSNLIVYVSKKYPFGGTWCISVCIDNSVDMLRMQFDIICETKRPSWQKWVLGKILAYNGIIQSKSLNS